MGSIKYLQPARGTALNAVYRTDREKSTARLESGIAFAQFIRVETAILATILNGNPGIKPPPCSQETGIEL